MCIHKYYIFLPCGHSHFSSTPLRLCPSYASSPPLSPLLDSSPFSRNPLFPPCMPRAHPFRSYALHIPCSSCLRARSARLAAATERTQPVIVPEARWRATYGSYVGKSDVLGTWGASMAPAGALRREDLERRREEWMREREGMNRKERDRRREGNRG